MDANLTINGYLGSDVDFSRTTQTGVAKATFRLACTPRILRQGTWTDDYTTWLTVICWRQLAEHVSSSLNKGDPVIVIGRLRTQIWDDDGGHHQRMVLAAGHVGHDLNRGISTFRRMVRSDESADGAAATQGEVDPDEPSNGPADFSGAADRHGSAGQGYPGSPDSPNSQDSPITQDGPITQDSEAEPVGV